jgi:hypothetical protein
MGCNAKKTNKQTINYIKKHKDLAVDIKANGIKFDAE